MRWGTTGVLKRTRLDIALLLQHLPAVLCWSVQDSPARVARAGQVDGFQHEHPCAIEGDLRRDAGPGSPRRGRDRLRAATVQIDKGHLPHEGTAEEGGV